MADENSSNPAESARIAPDKLRPKIPKPPRRKLSEAELANRHADRLQTLQNIYTAGRLYYIKGVKDYKFIGEQLIPPVKEGMVRKYLKKFADKVEKEYDGDFRTLIENIKTSFTAAFWERISFLNEQITQLRKSQKEKLHVDPEQIAQIRLLLAEIDNQEKNFIDKMAKMGFIKQPEGVDTGDWLFEIKARRAKLTDNNSISANADSTKE